MKSEAMDTATVFPPEISLNLYADVGSRITSLTNAGDGSGRLFITTRTGRVLVVQSDRLMRKPFLDITDLVDSASIEQGLLSAAFDPNFEENGLFYVYYTNLETDNDTVVARYRVSDDPNVADPAAREVILFVEQPANNHNGGQLAFGLDGYLYIGLGDGGKGNDPWGNAQNLGVLLGKILRIDVKEKGEYRIPVDNPFAGSVEARPEIWAYGLRNPWRFSIDQETGDFYIADVGENAIEELNVLSGHQGVASNFGWNIMEGSDCFSSEENCDTQNLIMPVFEYGHRESNCAIVGGYVYRGEKYRMLNGIYFFGDYCSGMIWGARKLPTGEWQVSGLLDTDLTIASFGESEAGDLFVLDLDGKIYELTERR